MKTPLPVVADCRVPAFKGRPGTPLCVLGYATHNSNLRPARGGTQSMPRRLAPNREAAAARPATTSCQGCSLTPSPSAGNVLVRLFDEVRDGVGLRDQGTVVDLMR